jgi:CheY-like chemotaxis protein
LPPRCPDILFFFLADDDEDDRMLFLEALAEINPAIECIMARNGSEALHILQDGLFELPDYIFLDLNMPVMNGLKCLLEIKKSGSLKHIPVILYSTAAEKEFTEASLKLGAMDFFVKPANFSGLLKYLLAILNKDSTLSGKD